MGQSFDIKKVFHYIKRVIRLYGPLPPATSVSPDLHFLYCRYSYLRIFHFPIHSIIVLHNNLPPDRPVFRKMAANPVEGSNSVCVYISQFLFVWG